MKDILELIALVPVIIGALLFAVALTPWPWVALIIYFLVTCL